MGLAKPIIDSWLEAHMLMVERITAAHSIPKTKGLTTAQKNQNSGLSHEKPKEYGFSRGRHDQNIHTSQR